MENENEISGLKVNIRKARISKVEFTFNEKSLPKIEVGLYLQTAQGKEITYLTMSTSDWNKNTKLPVTEIEPFVYSSIADILRALSPVAVRKINGIEKYITGEVKADGNDQS